VWMLPGAESSKPLVIIVMTYLVGIGGFAHVIAGSTEVLYAAVRGERQVVDVVFGYILPTLVGNVAGGLTMVAGINHAQAQSGK
jgi:formate-nitrite transporter family protein